MIDSLYSCKVHNTNYNLLFVFPTVMKTSLLFPLYESVLFSLFIYFLSSLGVKNYSNQYVRY